MRRQLLHRHQAQHRAPARPSALRADAARRHLSALCRGRPDLQPGLPGLAGALPARPGPDHQDQRTRRDQHAGPRQARARQDPAGFDQRGLRRSGDPSAGRGVLGPGQPDRNPELLRRRQALRRNPVLRLPPPAPAAHQGGSHLQYLRAAHACQRRPRGVQLHRAGAARREHHDLRRRPADPQLLLRGRPARGHDPHDEHRRRDHRPDQHRQPRRVLDAGTRQQGDRTYRLEEQAGAPAAAFGRSEAAPPRHHPGAAPPGWLGAPDAARGRPQEDDRLLRPDPSRIQRTQNGLTP
ncbi:SAM-dependent methyltransferase (fragment) [Burkholderiales bacterium 8X]